MTNSIISVPFHNDTLTATLVNSVPYVAIKPICEKLGIDWDSQRHRIDRHHVLKSTKVMITAVAADGKLREMLMLPINKLNGWLFGIDANRVKKESQQEVILYQEECFDVLANHFMPKVKNGLFDQLEMPDMPKPQIMPCHPTMMNSKMKNHVQHVIDLTAQSYGGTTNKVCMDLARYFHADSWEMIPMSFYPDICAYFNVHPRFKVGVKENWVMVKESSLELSSRIDLTVKLDTLQKTIEQIDWAKERAKNNSVEDAVFNLSSAVANLRTELAA